MKASLSKTLGFMFIAATAIGYASDLSQKPKVNLDSLKTEIIQYHTSGAYEYDIKQIADQAHTYLTQVIESNQKLTSPKKLAIVLDIDETSLSNYQDLKHLNFGGTYQMQDDAENKGDDTVIQPTLDLYRYAQANNVSVFFITGRKEPSRLVTIKNLIAEGYTSVKDSTDNCEKNKVSNNCTLYLRDGKYSDTSAIVYKVAMRKKIENAGYQIVINIGDQYSDLSGGYSLKTYKYPNYMYYIG